MSDEPPNSSPTALPPDEGGVFGRHFSARPQGSPYPKAELLPRLLARLTDLMTAGCAWSLFGPVGAPVAVLFLLFADGLWRGQSPGKRLLGIKVVELPDRRDSDFRASALRNFPFALALLPLLLPGWGRALCLWLSGGVVLFEGALAFHDTLGLRLGDLFAGTQVIDAKVLAAAPGLRPVLKAVGSEQGHARIASRQLLSPSAERTLRP